MSSILFLKGNAPALKSDATIVAPTPLAGCVLASSSHYFFLLGGDHDPIGRAPLAGAQVKWGTAFVGTITVEVCYFPKTLGGEDGTGPVDVSDFDTTKGNWMQVLPSAAYVTVTSTDGTTGGATVSNGQVSVAGGTAGGCVYDLGNLGARRVRLRVDVTTGDTVRCGLTAKECG